MIGNDIVDLKQAKKDSNWERPRFLDKVFTKSEQYLIMTSEDKNRTVWRLWSMKEAAYKIYVQQYSKRFFNPKKLECTLYSFEKGAVEIENNRYYTSSNLTENYIYTIATLNKETDFKSECFHLENSSYKTQTATLKKEFLKSVSNDNTFFEIRKTHVGVPQLCYKTQTLKKSFSITHHGVYGGYVMSI